MSTLPFYRPPPSWHFFAAFAAALGLEMSAVAFANLRPPKPIQVELGDEENYRAAEVILTESPPEPSPPAEAAPSPPPNPATDASDFVVTEPSPPSPPPTARSRVTAARSIVTYHRMSPVTYAPAREKMLFAPRPSYPYEARRTKETGSGRFLLRFDTNGDVTVVRVVQSTGSELLDQVSRSALIRWRCRPGVYQEVIVPVTYTLSGADF
jgi:TonB family protein